MSLTRRRKSPGWGKISVSVSRVAKVPKISKVAKSPKVSKSSKLTKSPKPPKTVKITNPISGKKITLNGPTHKKLIREKVLDANGADIREKLPGPPSPPSPPSTPTTLKIYGGVLDLAEAEAKKTKLDIGSILARIEDENNYEYDDPILEILPGAKLLVDESDYNICYHGQESTANSKRVYEYKTFYITSSFYNEGTDLEVLGYTGGSGGFDSLREWYKEMVVVYPKNNFNIHNFIPNTNKVDVLFQIYRNFYPKNVGFKNLVRVLKTKYDEKK